MFYKKIFNVILCGAFALAFAGCGGDDPSVPDGGDNSGTVSPDANVPDPTGTVELAMRDAGNGKTYLGNIYIETENFCGSGMYFANVGNVRGLGNVAAIPTSGWTNRVKVTPGCGYVAYDRYGGKYYRIYVSNYILNTSGGIIGADIKYQEPFGGTDEDIKLSETSISFGEDGGSQALFFDNSHIVGFSVESDAPWCTVQKATSYDLPFLYNGIVITVDKQPMAAQQANVTITTVYGRKKNVTVSYAGYEPYLTIGDMSELENVPFEGGTYDIGVSTNCAESVNVHASEWWMSASFENRSQKMRSKAKSLKFVDGKPLDSETSYDSANDVYALVVNVSKNEYGYARNGYVYVSSSAAEYAINVIQDYDKFIRPTGSTETEVDFEYSGNVYFGYETSYDSSELETVCDFGIFDAWFDVEVSRNSLALRNFKPNPVETDREATITLKSKDGLASATFSVRQKGKTIYLSIENLYEGVYYADRKAATYSLKVNTNIDNLTFTSSNTDMCTVTYTAGNVVLRMKECSENRIATVTCSDARGSFAVHQSKYAVGDDYSEGALAGKVYKMENGAGWIYKPVDGTYAWSTETIVTGCGNDGKANMDIIRSFPDWQTLYPAFAAVDALNTGGATGWYMPGKDEAVGLLRDLNYNYWLSSEYNDTAAYYYYYYNGRLYTNSKSEQLNVVAVNEFSY